MTYNTEHFTHRCGWVVNMSGNIRCISGWRSRFRIHLDVGLICLSQLLRVVRRTESRWCPEPHIDQFRVCRSWWRE